MQRTLEEITQYIDHTLLKKTKRARWKFCAQELHWHVQNANSVITT